MTLERVLGSALAGLGATLFMEQDVELEVVPHRVPRAQPEELFVSFPAVATTTPPTSPARSAATSTSNGSSDIYVRTRLRPCLTWPEPATSAWSERRRSTASAGSGRSVTGASAR